MLVLLVIASKLECQQIKSSTDFIYILFGSAVHLQICRGHLCHLCRYDKSSSITQIILWPALKSRPQT